MTWRFTDPKYDVLPPDHLAQVHPLDDQSAGLVYTWLKFEKLDSIETELADAVQLQIESQVPDEVERDLMEPRRPGLEGVDITGYTKTELRLPASNRLRVSPLGTSGQGRIDG